MGTAMSFAFSDCFTQGAVDEVFLFPGSIALNKYVPWESAGREGSTQIKGP